MDQTSKGWHEEVISAEVAETAERLAGMELLRGFYLAGGTGLALHLGHRRSFDLDFFCSEPFSQDALISALRQLPQLTVLSKSPQTVYVHVAAAKASFIGYEYPLLFPLEFFRRTAVAGVRDIACMKISALASRGSRRDFVDLYVAAQQYGLGPLLELFQQKFAKVSYSSIHINKALTYFADAEKEPMPDMLVPLSWGEVKEFFLREIRNRA